MKVHGMAGHLIRRMNQVSTHVFSRHMKRMGLDLTPVQFAAMDAISAHPGIDQAGVATEIAYDRATIGGVIDRLEQKGYVERTISRRDRRAREVRLTQKGRDIHRRLLPEVAGFQGEILPGLRPEERAKFLALARKVVESTSERSDEDQS